MTLQYDSGLRTNQVAQIQATVGGNAWAANTPYVLNQFVYNGSQYYQCTTSGISAASGGPTGTGTGIVDNTVHWSSVTPTLKIFSGSEPANCAAADPTGLLVTINLPAPFLTSATGSTTLSGTWQANASAGGSGTNAASFRVYDGAGACRLQGNVTADLVLNNVNIATGQAVQVTGFGVTAANS